MLDWTATTKFFAAQSVSSSMQSYVAPIVQAMSALAALGCVLFLIYAGYQYMTSSGQPESLAAAKHTIRNALLGLILVLAAGTLTTIFANAYHPSVASLANNLPSLSAIQPDKTSSGIVGVIIDAVTGILNDIVQSVAAPFLKALSDFTSGTPLIAGNSAVFNLWLAVTGLADAIFVVVVALLGLHMMSASTFGLEEAEFKHLLPQIGLTFLLINSSVFIIDGLISFSNAMIHALRVGFGPTNVWTVLTDVAKNSGGYGLAALLIMVASLILAVVLLVYYVGRIVMIYLGAVLAPLVLLMWLVPGFKDFATSAAKVYAATIFVLFVHVVILELAASLFTGMMAGNPANVPDPLMSMIVGVAALIALLKTQSFMMQLSYVSVGPRTARKLGTEFINGISYLNRGRQLVTGTVSSHSASRAGNATGGSTGSSSRSAASPNNYAQPVVVTASRTAAKANRPSTGSTTVAPAQPARPKSTKQEPKP